MITLAVRRFHWSFLMTTVICTDKKQEQDTQEEYMKDNKKIIYGADEI